MKACVSIIGGKVITVLFLPSSHPYLIFSPSIISLCPASLLPTPVLQVASSSDE